MAADEGDFDSLIEGAAEGEREETLPPLLDKREEAQLCMGPKSVRNAGKGEFCEPLVIAAPEEMIGRGEARGEEGKSIDQRFFCLPMAQMVEANVGQDRTKARVAEERAVALVGLDDKSTPLPSLPLRPRERGMPPIA